MFLAVLRGLSWKRSASQVGKTPPPPAWVSSVCLVEMSVTKSNILFNPKKEVFILLRSVFRKKAPSFLRAGANHWFLKIDNEMRSPIMILNVKHVCNILSSQEHEAFLSFALTFIRPTYWKIRPRCCSCKSLGTAQMITLKPAEFLTLSTSFCLVFFWKLIKMWMLFSFSSFSTDTSATVMPDIPQKHTVWCLRKAPKSTVTVVGNARIA